MPHRNTKHHKSHPQPKSTSTPQSQLPDSIRSDPFLIHLDGRTLEGGGQLVRIALTLSALTSIPVHIHHIRGNRSGKSSGQAGGLKSSHLAALEFLGHATAAKTYGAHVGSTELVFEPGRGKRSRKSERHDGDDVYEIRLNKSGSVWLILQAILPYIIFAASEHVPTRLLITGGTNVPKSMSSEYVQQVMLPTFSKIGLPKIEVDIRRRGWTNGRTIQLGDVDIKIPPFAHGTKLPAFSLEQAERGPITKIAISVLAGTEAMRTALINHTTRLLPNKNYPDQNPPEIEIALTADSYDQKRIYILLVAHTANGHRLGRDWLYDRKIKGASLDEDQMQFIAAKMAQTVVDELEVEIAHGGCVDEYMRDQLVVFEAVAEGRSFVESGGAESLHTRTCRWVVQQILGASGAGFDEQGGGGCQGVGFEAGEVYGGRRGVEERMVGKEVERGDEAEDAGLVDKLEGLGLQGS